MSKIQTLTRLLVLLDEIRETPDDELSTGEKEVLVAFVEGVAKAVANSIVLESSVFSRIMDKLSDVQERVKDILKKIEES